eukprot:6207824-Pleurochrysis_carterae.AAC.2
MTDAQTCANAPSEMDADGAGGGIGNRGPKDTQGEQGASLKMKRKGRRERYGLGLVGPCSSR